MPGIKPTNKTATFPGALIFEFNNEGKIQKVRSQASCLTKCAWIEVGMWCNIARLALAHALLLVVLAH